MDAKRQRIAEASVQATASLGSQIFHPFRVLGLITDEIPFILQQRALESYITVCTGKSYQIFNVCRHPSTLHAHAAPLLVL
jgi:hypothetical protein